MKVLISVSNKAGIVPFAKALSDMGYEIVSTGGTLKVLLENAVDATPVDEVTQFPEILDGRVKTLHPKIHGGILARRELGSHVSVCKEHGIGLIDLVVVNLYPFEKTISKSNVSLEDAIENIDIGGPSMVRSAAKNYQSVGVIVNPERYDDVLAELRNNNGKLSLQMKSDLACEAFAHTANYDTMIASFLTCRLGDQSNDLTHIKQLNLEKVSALRYGENPHQSAAFYGLSNQSGIANLIQHHGKALSYNNIVDLEAAVLIVKSLESPAAVLIKHTNPCGAAVGDSLHEAYVKAYEADPVSAFGSIIGLNRCVDKETAEAISQLFVEVVVAPGFDSDALKILQKKASIRLIELDFNMIDEGHNYRYVSGGFLVQSCDNKTVLKGDLTYPTSSKPSSKVINELVFANTIVKFVKSNAIVVVKEGQVVGVGAGQMSRVEAVEIALKKAGDKAKGAVLASDAFFPFKDSVELAHAAGIQAIIQPGGSKRDDESIALCDDVNLAMVFSGVRHFRH